MNAPELKPCPFCGGVGDVTRDHCVDGGGIFLTVKCRKCRAKSGEKYHSHGNDCPQTYQEVRDTWNKRADLYATPAARIAELEAALLKSREMLVWSFKEFSDCADADYFDALCDAISVSRKAISTTPSNAMKGKE